MKQKLLVALDGSECGKRALASAVKSCKTDRF